MLVCNCPLHWNERRGGSNEIASTPRLLRLLGEHICVCVGKFSAIADGSSSSGDRISKQHMEGGSGLGFVHGSKKVRFSDYSTSCSVPVVDIR